MFCFLRITNALILAFALSACTGGAGNLPASNGQTPASSDLGVSRQNDVAAREPDASDFLFVSNYTTSAAVVNVYNQNGKFVRAIPVSTKTLYKWT
jgi:hypothetical protein